MNAPPAPRRETAEQYAIRKYRESRRGAKPFRADDTEFATEGENR